MIYNIPTKKTHILHQSNHIIIYELLHSYQSAITFPPLSHLDRLLKGIVQRILRGVEIGIKKSVLVNWRPGRFLKKILMGHHHKRSKKPFSAA
jgi:hypothetical protein